ncbi:MAG: DedA family protein [Bdellovibrionaceae bacterium]|nr:DedA family protein [Pseudobdellovibrionaceae bacterium]NUM58188.1 DedA family protein [Pseudobdellovibrionaceae bacterium]
MEQILDIFLHLDVHLVVLSQTYGLWIYGILFLIIFCETGLVVTPFLPGDSLLFATGALAALPGSGVNGLLIWGLLIIAAFLGDNVNYHIGKWIGPKVFNQKKSLFFDPNHLQRTQNFYKTYGARTVIFARFLPIFRTFAPFVAGIGSMDIRKYMGLSLFGSTLWMSLFIGAGYFFGNLPSVKKQFHVVILAVIGISVLPILITAFKSFLANKSKSKASL